MEGEIRVTVVASGLEGERVRKPMRVVKSTRKPRETDKFSQYDEPSVSRAGSSRKSAPINISGQGDRYKPARGREPVRESEVSRRRAPARATVANFDGEDETKDGELTYLDLPTFLRRQAD